MLLSRFFSLLIPADTQLLNCKPANEHSPSLSQLRSLGLIFVVKLSSAFVRKVRVWIYRDHDCDSETSRHPPLPFLAFGCVCVCLPAFFTQFRSVLLCPGPGPSSLALCSPTPAPDKSISAFVPILFYFRLGLIRRTPCPVPVFALRLSVSGFLESSFSHTFIISVVNDSTRSARNL